MANEPTTFAQSPNCFLFDIRRNAVQCLDTAEHGLTLGRNATGESDRSENGSLNDLTPEELRSSQSIICLRQDLTIKQLQQEVSQWNAQIKRAIQTAITWLTHQKITLKTWLQIICAEKSKKEATALKRVVTNRVDELYNASVQEFEDGMTEQDIMERYQTQLTNIARDNTFMNTLNINPTTLNGYEVANRLAEYTHLLRVLNLNKSDLDDTDLQIVLCNLKIVQYCVTKYNIV
jgi:hypothetical protein